MAAERGAASAALAAPAWDPFVTNYEDDPYPVYARLRERAAWHCATRDVWAIARFDAVQAAARDWRTFSSGQPGGVNLDDQAGIAPAGNFINQDPPGHDVLRDVLRARFVPRAVAQAFSGPIERLLPRPWEAGEVVDLAADVAWEIPVHVIGGMLGIPGEQHEQFGETLARMGIRERGSAALPSVAWEATSELRAFFERTVAERAPRDEDDDVLADLIRARRAGEAGLTLEIAVDLCVLLAVAGTETTASLLSNALFLFAEHPEQRRLVHEGAVPITDAIEEVLRCESPVQYLARTVMEDTCVGDAELPAGARVALLYGAANRDEARWEDAAAFDVTRERKHNLAFGEGIHHCLGAPLARLEAALVLPHMLTLLGDYELLHDGVRRYDNPIVRGFTALPARVG
jgi:cytochrome P450